MATSSARRLTTTTFASPSSCSAASSTRSSKTSWPQSRSALAVALLLTLGTQAPGHAQNVPFEGAQTIAASQLGSPNAKTHPDRGLDQSGLSSLPAAAQGSISAALGKDDSRYWPHAAAGSLHAKNPQHALAANFTRHGVEISSNAARWDFALRGYGYGNDLVRTGQASPQARKNRVEYTRGALTEWYINGPLGLEQGFTLAKPPANAKGQPLTVALALSGNLTAATDASGSTLTLKQRDGKAALRVAGLLAHDATGRELQARFALRGGELLLQVDDAGAQYPLVVDPFVQQAELTALDGAANDHFGYSVAISGDGSTALVGAPYHTVSGNSNQGVVYAFTFSAGSWTQQPDLTASDGAFGDYFGSSVALSNNGTTALIGALGHTVNGNNQGTAYVFTFLSGNWTQQELTATDGAPGDAFGSSAALSGDGTTALVGAPAHNNQGAAYVFTLLGSSWVQQQELTASDITTGDSFGSSVALGGDATALIGAGYHAVNGNSYQGAAYVFALSGSNWAQQQELTASDGAADDLFGSSVAVAPSGTTALVGAPLATINGNSYAGSAYVFTLSGSNWTQQQELTAGGADEGFGNSVALAGSGTTALVGATLASVNGMSDQGAAYAFTLSGGTWTLQQELTAADGTANDYFANSVALSNDGTTAIVGALDHTVVGNSSQGAVYVWNTPSSQLIASPASLNFHVGVGGTFPKVVRIKNSGATKVLLGTATITPVSGDPAAFRIREYCQPRTLKPGKGCVIGIVFSPHEAGLSSATLNVPSNALGPQLEVPLTGTGTTKNKK
jgi:trimeric autotransporter adhesin